jgi:hypothetical protein
MGQPPGSLVVRGRSVGEKPHVRHETPRDHHSARRRGCRVAHGFTAEQMMTLLRANLATVTAERMVAAGRKIEVAVLRITEAGRKLLNEAHP